MRSIFLLLLLGTVPLQRAGVMSACSIATAAQSGPSFELWSQDKVALELEWVVLRPNGAVEVIRKQQVIAGEASRFPLSQGPNNFVRFAYRGASPHTVPTSELMNRRVHVPEVLPGGELFLIDRVTGSIRPQSVRIQGPRTESRTIGGRDAVSVSGLYAGPYQLIPVYAGGIEGLPTSFQIRTGETTVLSLKPQEVGGVIVDGTPEVCRLGQELLLYEQHNSGPRLRQKISILAPGCPTRIDGLMPGTYVAGLKIGQSVRLQEFEVVPQQSKVLVLTSFPAVVAGQVKLGDRPLSGVTIGLVPKTRAPWDQPAEVYTDGTGYFEVGVNRTGPYSIRLTGDGLFTARDIRVDAGRNAVNLSVAVGTLTIPIQSVPERIVELDLVLRRQGQAVQSSRWRRDKPSTHVFRGLAFDDYELIALVPGRYQREERRLVTITPGNPHVTVEGLGFRER